MANDHKSSASVIAVIFGIIFGILLFVFSPVRAVETNNDVFKDGDSHWVKWNVLKGSLWEVKTDSLTVFTTDDVLYFAVVYRQSVENATPPKYEHFLMVVSTKDCENSRGTLILVSEHRGYDPIKIPFDAEKQTEGLRAAAMLCSEGVRNVQEYQKKKMDREKNPEYSI